MRRPSVIIMRNCNDRSSVLCPQSNGCDGRGDEIRADEGSKGGGGSGGDDYDDDAASVHEVAATVMLPGHMLAALKPKSIIEKEQREALRRLKEERRRRRELRSPNSGGGGEGDSEAATVTITANVFLNRLMPACLARRSTLAELRGGCEDGDSSLSQLDLVDEELGTIHRNIMARTRQKYLAMEASSFWDRSFTGCLIVLTMVAILALFLYQNFGPGILSDHRY